MHPAPAIDPNSYLPALWGLVSTLAFWVLVASVIGTLLLLARLRLERWARRAGADRRRRNA